MAKKVYWSAFVDRAYGEAYRPHSSMDLEKLVRQMMDLHRTMDLGDEIIVISSSRIYANSGFQGFWVSKAGKQNLIGHIEMGSRPTFVSKDGIRRLLYIGGRLNI